MWKDSYLIVGDLFEAFAKNHEEVLTRSAFYEKLETDKPQSKLIKLRIGQGISINDIESLIASTPYGKDAFQVIDVNPPPKAMRSRTHKHKSQNILVSTAKKTGESEFELHLSLDEANEFLDDHMSGLHVQGMALVEASRQAFLSVTEQFFLADCHQDYYFVIQAININYRSFIFPISTLLKYRIVSQKIRPNRLSFNVEIDLIQNNEIRATSCIAFIACNRKMIDEKERHEASIAVDKLLNDQNLKDTMTTAA